MSFTHDDVQRIIQLLNDSHFDELHLEADGIKLDLRRNGAGASLPRVAAPCAPAAATAAVVAAAPASAAAPPAGAGTGAPPAGDSALLEIRAPMLGAFFRAPKPGAPAFISVGSRVEPDTVIGIIEVMKLMNSVAAGVSGEVVEILGADGELVEYEQVLVRVRPD